jgi:hypothetical protein
LINEIVHYRDEKKRAKGHKKAEAHVAETKNKIARQGMDLLREIKTDPIVRPKPKTSLH